MPSLRATLGALSAVTVAVVSSVTLTIALTSSLDALHAIGTRHAGALLDATAAETAHLFAAATDVAAQMQNFTASQPFGLPSEDERAFIELRAVANAAFMRAFPRVNNLVIYCRDNTRIAIDGSGEPQKSRGQYVLRTTRASNYTRDYPRQTVWEERLEVSAATHQVVRNISDPSAPIVRIREEPIWSSLHIGTFNSFAPVVYPPVAYIFGAGLVSVLVPVGAPLYAANVATRSQDTVLGYFIGTMSVDDLGEFLRRAKSTPNTAAFAYDRGGHIVATSEPAPFADTLPDGTRVSDGCTSTRDHADASDAAEAHHVICRRHVTAYPFAPLQAFAQEHAAALRPATGTGPVTRVRVAGAAYYAAAARVTLAFRGMEVYLLLLMPEADVIGDVITSRNVAIGVTCGLVVLAAAVNVAVVWLLLAPLGGIAERMVRAANLEDDAEDTSVSAMSEVAELQEAYYAMNAELNRIRSYVPQSVLVARRLAADNEETEDEGDLLADMQSTDLYDVAGNSHTKAPPPVPDDARRSSHATVHSQGTVRWSVESLASTGHATGPRGRRSPSSPLKAHPIDLAATTVHTKMATVLCVNIVGLHRATDMSTGSGAAMGAELQAASIAAAAALVERAVAQRHGVLTFHGDRFLATFNTARPCGGHASKAALAAVAVAGQAVGPAGLVLSAGVATGPCAVGSMGSATMKTLSTVGPAVSNAAALERLTRQHAGVAVLAAHRTCVDAATAVGVRYVDFAALQANKGGAPQRAVVGQLFALESTNPGGADAADGDAEWMYVLRAAGHEAHAAYNAVFEALHRDDEVGALKAYAAAEAANAEGSPCSAASTSPADAPVHHGSCPPRLVELISELRRAREHEGHY